MDRFITPTFPELRTINQKAKAEKLFSGIWIRWQVLTVAERFVCANIVLIPIWWIAGLMYYMPLLLLVSIAVYECWSYGKLRLKAPSIAVIALLIFGFYQIVRLRSLEADLPTLYQPVTWWITPALWLWYIQSTKVRLRFEVVAWAFTVSAVQHLGLWLICQFVLPESFFFPPHFQTLLGRVTQKSGGETFLVPFAFNFYEISKLGVAGLNRFQFFTRHPLHASLIAGVMGLIALDIKNRFWWCFLFSASIIQMFVTGSRTLWMIFPIVVILHYLLLNRTNNKFNQILYALLAIGSFALLSLPHLTHEFSGQFFQSVEAIDELRAGSSETRLLVYQLTWQGIQENLLWGHIITGAAVDGVFVGLESFILGQLLYINGLVGTLIFAVFWIALWLWLYKTRADRPMVCFSVLIFYTLASTTLESVYRSDISSMLLLLSITLVKLKPKSNQVVSYYA